MQGPCFIFNALVAFSLGIVLACGGCAGFAEALSAEELVDLERRVSTYPADTQAGFAMFRARCSTCHSIAEPLSARVSSGRWRRVVSRMARKPASGIRQAEIDPIANFLKHHFDQESSE